jgi:glutaredoxin
MPTICPKCGYARKEADTAPSWQCPSCQVAYNKVGDTSYSARDIGVASQTGYIPHIEKPSHTWKWILLVALVIGIASQGKFFSKRSVLSANQIAQSEGQPSVVFYSATWCGYCRAAREFFDRTGIAYTEHDIEKSTAGAEGYRKLGGGGIPLIMIGDEKIRGFSAAQLQQKLGPWIKQ